MMIIPFTLTMEYSGARERIPLLPWVTWSALLANIINVPFSLGEALPPLFAIGLTDWVEYQAAISSVILGGEQAPLVLKTFPSFLLKYSQSDI